MSRSLFTYTQERYLVIDPLMSYIRDMKKLKDVIYLKSDAIVLNKDQIDPFENLIGDINDQLEKKGISLCYCYDKLKNNKAKIHGWDLRPKPQASSSKHQAPSIKLDRW